MAKPQYTPPSDNPLADKLRGIKKATITVNELAEIIPFSKFTIYAWAKENKIPNMRIGSKVLFQPNQVADWIEQRCA